MISCRHFLGVAFSALLRLQSVRVSFSLAFCDWKLRVAEGLCRRGPFSEPGRNHIGDHATDIPLLGRVIVGARMIARHGHRPGRVARLELDEKARGIIDVAIRIEHVGDTAEMCRMVMVVDLHAAEIDELRAVSPCLLEEPNGLDPAFGEHCFSFYVQCVGLQAPLPAGFGEADRIEDTGRYAIAGGGAQDRALAWIS